MLDCALPAATSHIAMQKKYSQNDFDILFIYTAKAECYIIPWKTVDIRNELTVDAKKYRKYRVA